ncbi:MAG: class I SAM-dependent methyltransferase [Chloroflexi bacterium]|nr:class I SAM-dependent methyltransferase [Chloroflexota bacterium]
MERITDWAKLWRELVEARAARHRAAEMHGDAWKTRARTFDADVKRRWQKPDSSRAFLLSQVRADDTLLDIGAGTGAWSIYLAPHVRRVTAIEPSPSMIAVMRENLAEAGVTNVDILSGRWPEVEVQAHDISLCAHAMYMSPDLPGFIRHMEAATRRLCVLLMRVPLADNVMALAARRVWGQPHDSPNFVIAYNILLEMGICANVLMEDTGAWGSQSHETLEEALEEIKNKLGLGGPSEHDDYLCGLLRERLTYQDGRYIWPPSVRSALVYWEAGRR